MPASTATPIVFQVPGQRHDGAALRGAPGAGWAATAAAPSAGLGGTLLASVRVGSMRAGGESHRLEALPGRDVVVLQVANGPALVLHPQTARDLLLAQSDARRPAAAAPRRGSPAADTGPVVVEVPAALRWEGLESASAAARGAARGWLGDVVLAGFEIVRDVVKDRAADWVAGELARRIDGRVAEGVYRLAADAPPRTGAMPPAALADTGGAPTLVLIHGTFSTTEGSFAPLWTEHPHRLRSLFERYRGEVYALDHHTLGASPIDNALTLARACPRGARLHLATHSRGGLVAEVLARAGSPGVADVSLPGAPAGQANALRELAALMAEREVRVERVVRVACPARGTLLASQRLDAYVSVLRWALELAGLPVLPELVDFLGGVAQKRTDASALPGLEAMVPDSALIQWLHDVEDPIPGDLRVVAGDLEGDSIGSWLKTLMADAFYWTDNDLVVQTRSMYGGAPRRDGATFVFDQGGQVTHFRYFSNERTAEAVVNALLHDAPSGFRTIGPLSAAGQSASGERAARRRARGGEEASRMPAVFVLPGIMGSHLKVDGRRLWLGWRTIARLRRLEYREQGGPRVEPDGPVGLIYDDLMDHLAATHEVIEFAFDWRRPIEDEARRLAAAVEAALDARTVSGLPVRLLAHSMGGVVARVMQLECGATWDRMMSHPGARLLMLGTPNGGSWAPMQVLSGDDTFGNTLIAIGAPFQDASARQVVAGFPGLMQLQAGLAEEGHPLRRADTWRELARRDREALEARRWWHREGPQLAVYDWGLPPQPLLDRAAALRERLDRQAREALPAFADRLRLVLGRADETPDGYEFTDDGLVYLNAVDAGDGRVLDASAMLPGVPTWRVAAEHGTLPDAADAFEAYREILETGQTTRLEAVPVPTPRGAAGAAVPAVTRVRRRPSRERADATPPADDDALHHLARRAAPRETEAAKLRVTVHNTDLRFTRHPLVVGHYRSSKLTGTERIVDRLIGGSMGQSLALGQYPEEPGAHQVFANLGVNADNPLQLPRPEAVIVVGLGDEGGLRSTGLAASVRQGVLALARRLYEDPAGGPAQFELAATLVGSGGIGISPGQAAQSVALGAHEADRAIREMNLKPEPGGGSSAAENAGGRAPSRRWPRVAHLHLVELYLDRSTEAWRAVKVLAESHPNAFDVGDCIANGAGALRRPIDGHYRGTDYDLLSAVSESTPAGDDRIVYTVDTRRARSEVRAQSTQARLVRELVASAANDHQRDPHIGRTLFRLLVPVELEPYLGGSAEMQIELDRGTAGIPWELLDPDPGLRRGAADTRPWAVRSRLIRKLRLEDFRTAVRDASPQSGVLVIGEPDCDTSRYPRLPGARREARAVHEVLARRDLLPGGVTLLVAPDDEGLRGPSARDVINTLMASEWRVVHIAGHGEMPLTASAAGVAEGPSARVIDPRGVVLSNGTFLGPREIRSMRVVPELVFVNCCHLGARHAGDLLRPAGDPGFVPAVFASTVAEELIRIGVRCVVAAGWAVDDLAASSFAKRFYEALCGGRRFIDAVAEAREAAREHGGNTWAAYQCYGDPNWHLRDEGAQDQPADAGLRREFEGIASAPALAIALETIAIRSRHESEPLAAQQRRIRHLEGRFGAAWGSMGAVAEAFAVAWQASGDPAAALDWYRRAVSANDASASLKASEQLANLIVREAWREVESAARVDVPSRAAARPRLAEAAATARGRIADGVERLQRLVALQPTLERLSLLGSAHKRSALVERALLDLVAADGSTQAHELAAAESAALERMRAAYAGAEQAGRHAGLLSELHYPMLNQLAATVALGRADGGWSDSDASALRQLRQALESRAAADPDFWSVVGLAELRLLEALVAGRLAAALPALAHEFADLQARVPSRSHWSSVADELDLLLPRHAQRHRADRAEADAAHRLRAQVRGYAAA